MMRKKVTSKPSLEELNSAHRLSQAKCQLIQTNYINRIKLFLFSPYNKHLINRAKSVCMGESWPRSCVQTSLRSGCTYDLGQDSPIQTSSSVNKSYIFRKKATSALAGFHVRTSLRIKLEFWNNGFSRCRNIGVRYCCTLKSQTTSSEARANIELNQYMAQDRNWTQATLVGGESSHHWAIPGPNV